MSEFVWPLVTQFVNKALDSVAAAGIGSVRTEEEVDEEMEEKEEEEKEEEKEKGKKEEEL